MGEPARVAGLGRGVALAHEVAEPLRIDRLSRLEAAGRAAGEPAHEVGQLLADDALPDPLVRELEVLEKVLVEEMAEGPVADVVE